AALERPAISWRIAATMRATLVSPGARLMPLILATQARVAVPSPACGGGERRSLRKLGWEGESAPSPHLCVETPRGCRARIEKRGSPRARQPKIRLDAARVRPAGAERDAQPSACVTRLDALWAAPDRVEYGFGGVGGARLQAGAVRDAAQRIGRIRDRPQSAD